jgi:hypothetical protein
MKCTSSRIRLAALVLFALLVISFVIWRVNLAHDLNAKLAAIHAAGMPTNGKELNDYYPAVPDNVNAALVMTQALAFMANYPDERSNAVSKFAMPACSQPLTSEQKELLAGHVELNRAAIQTARQGLLRPKCRYPIDMSPGFATLLPHLAHLKNLAQTISFEGMLAVEDNKPNEAIQSIGTILQLSKTLENEPLLISKLVRFRMDNMAKLTLERCLNVGQLNEDNLASLHQLLQGWEETNMLVQAMVGEQAMAIPLFHLTFAQFSRFAEQGDADIRNIHDGPGAVPITFLMRASGFFQRDLRFYLAVMETNINLSKISSPNNLAITNIWNDAMTEIERRHLMMSGILLPALDKAYFKNAESVATIRVSRLALAVEQFRLLQNRLPQTLDELQVLISMEVSTDPFDGQPLRYQRLAKGYAVYSVGRDCHDDGGRQKPADWKSTDKTTYDITFTVER